jgi:cell division septation protein DedD
MRASQPLSLIIAALAIVLLAGCSRVKDDWRAAQGADTNEAYQDFLQQHPDSEFAAQAQARLKQLAEDRDWQQVAATDTRDAYEQFVAQHADSKWAQEARVRIENFNLGGGDKGESMPGETTSAASMAPGVSGTMNGGVAATPAGIAASPVPATPARPATPTREPPRTSPPKSVAAPPVARPSAGGTHLVQLGAYSTRARAESEWQALQGKYASELKGLKPRYVAAHSQGKAIVRVQIGLATERAAGDLCAKLKRRGQACIPAS